MHACEVAGDRIPVDSMKRFVGQVLARFKVPIDLLLLVLAIPSAIVLKTYRRLGSANSPYTTRVLKRIGVFPISNHYYEPLFDDSQLTGDLSEDRDLPGLDLNVSGQLGFLDGLAFSSELIELDLDRASDEPGRFHIGNDNFGSGDAEFLYQVIRTLKPARITEIGSGNSTKIARLALRRNFAETGDRPVHTCIEPYEMRWLEELGDVEVIREPVERVSCDWGTELGPGDLLFVDSTHMIRPQGDVLKEYLEIFPRLGSGVLVHIHDIFTPKDYPRGWVVDDVRFWNEQYLLEGLLAHSDRYEVVAAVNHLKHHHFDRLKSACPYLTEDREPGSFYFRVR